MSYIIRKIFKIFSLIGRTYAHYFVGDKAADSNMCVISSLYFRRIHGYWPNFKNPTTFTEKIWQRMLFNRDPRLTLFSDKCRVRDYVKYKGEEKYLIPLIWHGYKTEYIPFNDLPQQFVIKCNHGCGYNIIVKDKTLLDIPKTKKLLNRWIKENFCMDKFLGTEWAYKNIEPYIMIEEFIGYKNQIPKDYKFFCYSGNPEYLLITFDRFQAIKEKHFKSDFSPINVWNGAPQFSGEIIRPGNYEEMLKLAKTLSDGIDFIRVDLYSVGKRIYFGELTCYPSGGIDPFIPVEYDFIFGEKWKIERKNIYLS